MNRDDQSALTVTLSQLKDLRPCRKRLKVIAPMFGEQGMTARQAVRCGVTLSDLIWVATKVAKTNRCVERRLRMCAADWAADVLHIYERDDTATLAPRKAINAARAYANGQIDEAARAAAESAAWSAALDATNRPAEDGTRSAATSAAAVVTLSVTTMPGAMTAVAAAAWAAIALTVTVTTEEDWQLQRLAEWLSPDEPEPVVLPRIPDFLRAPYKEHYHEP